MVIVVFESPGEVAVTVTVVRSSVGVSTTVTVTVYAGKTVFGPSVDSEWVMTEV